MSAVAGSGRPPYLDFVLQADMTAAASLACDRYHLARVAAGDLESTGVLRVYALAGSVLSVGRYHLLPRPQAPSSISLYRRLSGGRVRPSGAGFVGVSLILPQRGALLAQPAPALQPYQVLNRYVRGLLAAFKMASLPVIYPGLDAITVRRLPFAMISLEETPHGAVLVEAIIANDNDFSLLPRWLDAADPAGVIQVEMIEDDAVTSLKRELGSALSLQELGTLMRHGFEKQFGVACQPLDDAGALPAASPDRRESLVAGAFDRHAAERTQLGSLEVHLSLAADKRIADIVLVGDFIANSAAIDELETRLRGCAANAVDAVVQQVFASAPNFILGVGQVSTLTQVITRALL